MKTQLPNGCSISELSVNPKNWNTKAAKTTIDWFISYRFYDPAQEKPKQVVLRGMNYFKSLQDRKEATIKLIEQEKARLSDGYNPYRKDLTQPLSTDESMVLYDALKFANSRLNVAERTKKDLDYLLSLCETSIAKLGYQELKIKDVSRKHIKALLDFTSNTPDRFNKYRSYLMILLAELVESEIVDSNFAKDIRKKKCLKHARTTLSGDERVIVDNYLRQSHKEFHRFLHIFFHSGARISELLRMKTKDVQLQHQRFRVVVQKGAQYREVWKTIKNIVLPYWAELLQEAQQHDILFSRGLKPGKHFIQPYQIGKRWYRLVKKRLGITADFYSLKHLHTTEVAEYLGDQEAAKHNSHTSTNMVKTVYDIRRKEREQNSIKELNNPFV